MARRQKTHWMADISVQKKGLMVVFVPLFVSVICLILVSYALVADLSRIEKHHHTRQLQENMTAMVKSALDMGLTLARYHLFKDPKFIAQYDNYEASLLAATKNLDRDARGSERRHVEKLRGDVKDLVTFTHQLKESMQKASRLEMIGSGVQIKRKISKPLQNLQLHIADFETEIQLQVEDNPKDLSNKMYTLCFFIGCTIVLTFVAAMLMFRLYSLGIINPLKILTDNTYRLARSEALNPPITGLDELAHLDRVFHDMANALAEAARKERAVVQHAIDVICSIDGDGRFTAVSPASLHVWGYAPEELMGRQFTELVATADLEATLLSFKRIKDEETEPQPFESRVVRKNGSVVHILWSAYWAASEQSMFCVAHDITERKETEEQLKASEMRVRSIFESAPVALVVVDLRGTVKLLNPKAERMFGYRMEQIVDQHISRLLPLSGLFDEANFREDMLLHAVAHVKEAQACTFDGRSFPVELTLETYQTAEGEQFLAAILDVSERHEVERLKREFVSTVSHELRTPLTAIRGSLGLLAVGAVGKLPDQAENMVKMAERNCMRLINLINDLLDMEKLEAGKLEMVLEDTSIAPILERSIEAVRAFGQQYGVNLDCPQCDTLVRADGDRLVQVIVNLLSNAIKYSPKESTVSIATHKADNCLRLSVHDCGRGIPEHLRERVFERFQQVEVADAKQKGGTGLGLAICKAIIDQHHGSIGVDSEEGKGSTFWIEIPLAGVKSILNIDDGAPASNIGRSDEGGAVILVPELNKVAEERS